MGETATPAAGCSYWSLISLHSENAGNTILQDLTVIVLLATNFEAQTGLVSNDLLLFKGS